VKEKQVTLNFTTQIKVWLKSKEHILEKNQKPQEEAKEDSE